MSTTANKTTDHGEIKPWVEKRGGRPASAPGSGGKDDGGGLRINFPEASEPATKTSIIWTGTPSSRSSKKLS